MLTPKRSFSNEARVERLATPLELGPLLDSLRGARDPAVLESGQNAGGMGRWHVLAAFPRGSAEVRGLRWRLELDGRVRSGESGETTAEDPLTRVEEWWESWAEADPLPPELAEIGAPFAGGAIGYLGYELGRFCTDGATRGERRLDVERAEPFERETFDRIPDLQLKLYDEVLLVDCESLVSYFVHRGREGVEERRWWERPGPPVLDTVAPVRETSVSISDEDYLASIDEIRSLIEAGDVYEVNLTRCHRFEGGPNAWQLYQRLRTAQPVPYGAFLPWGPVSIVSASPERFLRRTGDRVETRPIKGTALRTGDPEHDGQARAALLASEKERAELAMIIDVERNDLGRVCESGSVVVVDEAALEQYSTVFHTVATVRGRLPKRCSPFRLLRATFPGGSITGAPKIAAMEAIRRFEPCPRKTYTGSIGWLAPNGDLDLSIAIRTALRSGEKTLFAVGGAVTWDSIPEAELEELAAKGQAILRAIQGEGTA